MTYTAQLLIVPLIAALGEPPTAVQSAAVRYDFTETHMAMPFRISLYATDQAAANAAAQAAFARIARLNTVFSDYDPQSELSRLSATSGTGQAVQLSPPLWDVLHCSQQLARRSDGGFDITVGNLTRLWRRARRMRKLPSQERLKMARQATGHKLIQLDPDKKTAELLKPNMRLDLGGIAVGYAIDEAMAILREHGFSRALVDGSGDIVVGDPPPERKGWRIGIAPLESPKGPPSRYILLKNAAVTTSGDAFQYVEIDGRRYSHIVDPRTGLGLTERSSVTVIAADGITADSLATAASVLGPKAGLALVEGTPRAAALVVRNVDGKLETRQSKRFAAFLDEQ